MFDTGAATAARLTSVAITATLAVRGESPSVASGYDSLEAKHNGIPYAPPVTTTVTETVFSTTTTTTTAYDTATTEYITEFEVLPPVTTTVTDLEVIPAITVTVTDLEVIPPVTVTVTDFHVLPPVTVTMTDYISSTPEPNPNNSVAEMTNPLNKRFELPDVWSNTQEESYLKTLDGILANLLDDEQFAIYQSATKSKVAPFPQEKATRRRMFPYQFGLVTQRFFTHRDKTDPEQIWDEPRQRAYLYSSAMVLKPYLTSKQWRTLRSFQAMASGFNDTESFSPRLKAAWDLGHLIYDSFPDDLLDVSPYKSLPKSEVILHGYQDDEIDALDTKPKGEDEGEPKDQDESKDKSKDDSKDTSKDESKDQDKSKDDSKDKPKEESKDKPKEESKDKPKEESKDQDKSDQDSKDQDKSKDDPKSQDDSKDQEKPKDDPKSQDTPKDPNDKSPDNTPPKPTPTPSPPDDEVPPAKPSRKENTESEYGPGAIVLSYSLAQETDSTWVGDAPQPDLDAVLTLAVAAFPQTGLGSTAIRITALPDGRVVNVGLDPAFLSMSNEKRKRDGKGWPLGLGFSGLGLSGMVPYSPYSQGLGIGAVFDGVRGVDGDAGQVGLGIGEDK